ncbi:MAG: N-acetyltransferase [Methanothrix sp.]
MNSFLSEDAKNSQEDLISRTYLCLERDRTQEFISLITDTIEVKLVEKDDDVDGYPYPRYPAIKIARLAVDERAEGRGIGRFLLLWAIGKTYQLSGEVGCR